MAEEVTAARELQAARRVVEIARAYREWMFGGSVGIAEKAELIEAVDAYDELMQQAVVESTMILARIPEHLLDGLPEEDQVAIRAAVGSPVRIISHDAGRTEVEFQDAAGDSHTIWIDPEMLSQLPPKGKIVASCGHEASAVDDLVEVRFGDWDCNSEGFHRIVIYGSWCRSCADALRASGDLIETDEEEEAWFNGK